jgi:hypothetical protein
MPMRRDGATPLDSPEMAPAVSAGELATQEVIRLSERAAMSLVNLDLAAPINAALALNAFSDNSAALAGALQTTPIIQGMSGARPTL